MAFKVGRIVSRWIFILCLPVLLLSASIAWGFNSLWIYKYGFEKYNVSQTTGLAPSEVDKIGRGMIQYFNSGDEYVQFTVTKDNSTFQLFNEEEQIHLKNVKQLVWLDYRFLIVSFILVLSYALFFIFWRHGQYRRQLFRSIVWGSSLTLGLILITGIAVYVDFDWLWVQFHLVSFSDNFWYAPGYMVLLFGSFWYNAVLIALAFMAGLAFVLGISSIIYLRFTRKSMQRLPSWS